MPSLAELTDSYQMPEPQALPVDRPRVLINTSTPSTQDSLPIGESPIVDPTATDQHPIINKLLGLNGEERYQLWPEKVVREALAAPHDTATGQLPQYAVDTATGDVHTSPQMIEGAQAVSALAGSGGLAGADASLGSTAFLRPALKYENKIYKAPIGGQHLDALPEHLYNDFQQKAMNGEDINHYNFGFMNHKGQFLDREKALDYGIKEGLIDPSAGQYGALTSTLLADSSKPGTAIEAMAKTWNVKGHENENWFHGTTHDFNKFSLAKGNIENHLGQYPHFTNNPKDASANYAGHGPDLTSRIENRAEQIAQDIADKKYNGVMGDDYGKIMTVAKKKATEELAGPHEGAIIPAKIKMNNPADVTPDSKTWIDFAAKTDKEGEWIKDNPNTIKLLNSLEKQGEKYGFDGRKIFNKISEKTDLYDSVKANDLYKALRDNEDLGYAQHSKTGKLSNGHVIANIFKDLGFDGLVMDAKAAFPHMKDIPEGTLHAVPLKKKSVSSKLTGNILYSDTHMFTPVAHDPFNQDKNK